MPSSAVRTFTDPDEYAAAIRNARTEMTVTERGQFAAKIIRIDLHRLWMQRFSDNLPRISHTADVWRPTVTFRTQPGPSLLRAGAEMQPTNLVRHPRDESGFQRSSGSANWGAMSLPLDDMISLGETMGGLELAPPKDPRIVNPSRSTMARLQRLHAAAGDLAEHAPEIIADPSAAQALEQALIEAMVLSLRDETVEERGLSRGQHAIVMRRFWRVLEENPEQPLYVPEICKAIRVSERTLRMCCHEHLGVGPKRYLLLRRMHFARRALCRAAPGMATVTEIATRFGFWQLGRFAVEYQSLFGETPSATLRREAEQPSRSFAEIAQSSARSAL